MLMPKKVKYRKQQRGRMKGKAWRGSSLEFGDYGLKTLDAAWLTDRQIEAGRIAMTRFVKRGGKVWIRIFPDKPGDEETGRNEDGKRQGCARILGRARQTGPDSLRDGRRAGGNSQGSHATGGSEVACPDKVRRPVGSEDSVVKSTDRLEKLKNLSAGELEIRQEQMAEEAFRLRFQWTMGRSEALKKLRDLRRDRARVLTLLREKQIEEEKGS